jgi:hypothetical protein
MKSISKEEKYMTVTPGSLSPRCCAQVWDWLDLCSAARDVQNFYSQPFQKSMYTDG